MLRRPAKDGGHTAFTDHRISRYPSPGASAISSEIHAWREPPPEVRERNLALALVTTGFENNSSDQMIRGYKMLNRLDKTAANDPEVQTALGSILLKAKESAAAVTCFTRALSLRQNYAPYEVNLGTALLSDNLTAEAVRHFEKALELDPLLRNGVYLLASAYRSLGENAKADLVISKYRKAMGFSALSPRLEPMGNN
jgi:predicted Zn-dependent protease